MKILNSLYLEFVRLLNTNSGKDGRIILLLAIVSYFGLIFTVSHYTAYEKFWWVYLKVPAMDGNLFGDLRVITSGLDCHRLGLDVLVSNPCNPWQSFKEVNYPRVWMWILEPLGIGQSDTIFIGAVIVILFYFFVFLLIRKLNYGESIVYIFLLCSPSIILGLERANSDLIIFILLSIGLLLSRSGKQVGNYTSYLLIFFSSILKLFPIITLFSFVEQRKKNYYLFAGALLACFMAYLFLILDDLQLIYKVTPREYYWSYGINIFFGTITRDLSNVLFHFKVSENNIYLLNIILNSKFFVFSIAALLLLWIKRKSLKISYDYSLNYYINEFRFGALIYISTYILIGYNWGYRLTFLIFTIPQILFWIRNNSNVGKLSFYSLLCLILSLWLKTSLNLHAIFINQIIDLLLMSFYAYALFVSLPPDYKRYISSRLTGIKAPS